MEDFMAELKRQPIWFLWQWKSSKTGKQTKVPLSAHGGPTGTSAEWAHTWVTYDEAVAAERERAVNVDHFLALVRKYTDIQELTAGIIREFVKRVYVYQAERIDGKKVQRIRIEYNCIGEITAPKQRKSA